MKKLLILGMVAFNGWSATLGVPNILISPTVSTPSFISTDSQGNIDSNTAKLVQQQVTNFSAQVRGQIIQNKYFQVVDVDSNSALGYLTSESEESARNPVSESTILFSESNSPESDFIPKAVTKAESPTQPRANKQLLPDYLLIGIVSAINAGEEVNPITDTNKYSAVYSVDIAVDYKLVRTKDRNVLAAFTAAGHAGDVKLTSNPNQKMVHNIPKLVKQVGEDLANEVINQLAIQLENGKLVRDTAAESTPKITDVKVYN